MILNYFAWKPDKINSFLLLKVHYQLKNHWKNSSNNIIVTNNLSKSFNLLSINHFNYFMIIKTL